MRWTAPLALLLLLGACGGRQVKQGDALAAQGDWVAAYETYEQTLRKSPGNKRAAAGRAEAAPLAAQQLCQRATQALNLQDWDWAWRDLQYALSVQAAAPCLPPLYDRLRAEEAAAAMALLEARELELGYRRAWSVAGRFPQQPEALAPLTAARELTLSASSAALNKGDAPLAMAMLDLSVAIEGQPAPGVAEAREEVKRRWSASLGESAAAAQRAGELASAYVYAHMAAGVSGDPKRAELARQSREALHAALALPVAVAVRAPSPRPERFTEQLRAAQVAPSLRWSGSGASSGASDVVIEARLGPPRCEASVKTWTEAVAYERVELRGNPELPPLAAAHQESLLSIDSLDAELGRLRGEREGLVQAHNASSHPPDREALRLRVLEVEGSIREREQLRAQWVDRANELAVAINNTPELIEVAVPYEAPLQVSEHTRRCVAGLSMTLASAGQPKLPLDIERSASVSDRAHGPLPIAGVLADPLAYPRGDGELLADIDRALALEASALLGQELQRRRDEALRAAASAETLEAATGAWVKAWWLGDAAPDGMKQALTAVYPGLRMGWLVVQPK